jgi:hypothetical protein
MSAAFALVERAVQRKFFKAPTVAQKNGTAQIKIQLPATRTQQHPSSSTAAYLHNRIHKTRSITNHTAAYPFSRVGWEKIQPTFCSPSMPASPSTSC